MKGKLTALLAVILFTVMICCNSAYAASVPQKQTKDYKVAYYAFDCFNMQNENGKKYGYGYDMMQDLSGYMQCTFS